MSDTSIPTSARLLARSSPASSSSRTWQDTGLLGLPMSFLTLPRWGMTCAGDLYELPTPERPTAGNESSSLPTPTARDYKEQTLGWTWQRDGVTQEDTLPRALTALLPTPSANDTTGSETATARAARGAGGPMLRDIPALLPTPRSAEAEHAGRRVPAKPGQQQGLAETCNLLPTPTVMDMGSNYTPEQWEAWKAKQRAMHANGNGNGASLTQEAISLLPTPTAQQGRNATSGRQPGAVFNSGTTLQDVIYAGEIGPLIGESTQSPSGDGSPSSAGQHPTPPPQEPTDDHDSPLTLWNG